MILDSVLLPSGLAGMAAFCLAFAAMRAGARRRVVSARLERFVGAESPLAAEGPANHPRREAIVARLSEVGDTLRGVFGYWSFGHWFILAALVLVPAAVLRLTGDLILTAAAAIQVLTYGTLWGQDLVAARLRLLDVQTLPTILRMSAALRAGSSLLQSLEVIARDGPSPTRDEFARAVREVGLGASLDDALDRLVDRVRTVDYKVLAVALSVQRRAGGNLALVLDRLAETARDSTDLRQEALALTAQQRLSSWILALLPLVTAAVFGLADRTFLSPLFTTLTGRLLVLAATVMLAVGAVTLRRVGRVEV